MVLLGIQFLLGALFIYLSILTMVGTKYTKIKFEQLRVPRYFRYVTGFVQFLGGMFMLSSVWYSEIAILGGIWIAVIMLVGIVLRIRSGESILSTIPAIIIGLLSLTVTVVNI